MAGLTKTIPRFLTGRNTQNGLAGILQRLIGGQGIKGSGIIGTINIPSGSTTLTVTDTAVQSTDVFIVSIQGKPTNVCYFTGITSITANTSYVLNVNTDPGTGGVTLLVIRLPGQLLYSS